MSVNSPAAVVVLDTKLEFSADRDFSNFDFCRFATSIICRLANEFFIVRPSMLFDDAVVEFDDDELFGVNFDAAGGFALPNFLAA